MFIKASLENRTRFLKRIRRTRKVLHPEIAEKIEKCIEKIKSKQFEIDGLNGIIDDIRWQLMGLEGIAAKQYFDGFRSVFPDDLEFKGRVKRPPRDPVNSCLSFGYTMLYGDVLVGIAAAGLEPFAGFIHADRSGKPSLALDLIEEFRQVTVDRLVLKLFSRKKLGKDDFALEESRCLFTDRGKELFIKEYNDMIDEGILMPDGKQVSFKKLIIKQARLLTRYLVGKSPTYDPFLIPW